LYVFREGFTAPTTPTKYYLIINGWFSEDNTVQFGSIPNDVGGFNFSKLLPVSSYAKMANILYQIPAEFIGKKIIH
jgi:hypothetical protein